jgi:hypothetical protein
LHHASFGQPGFAGKLSPMQVVRSIWKQQRNVFVSSLALPADVRFAIRSIVYQGCCWSSRFLFVWFGLPGFAGKYAAMRVLYGNTHSKLV